MRYWAAGFITYNIVRFEIFLQILFTEITSSAELFQILIHELTNGGIYKQFEVILVFSYMYNKSLISIWNCLCFCFLC